MQKLFAASLFMLLIATTGILVWQWDMYSDSKDAAASSGGVRQTVTISQGKDSIQITQTIDSLPKGNYTIHNPMKASFTLDGTGMSDNAVEIKKDGGSITFAYALPLKANGNSKLFSNWAIGLNGVETVSSSVEITSEKGIGGSWGAAAKQIGSVNKEYIHYVLFEKEGPLFPIFYEVGKLSYIRLEAGPYLYYPEDSTVNIPALENAFESYDTLQDKTILFTSNHPPSAGEEMLIMGNGNNAAILKQILTSQYADSLAAFSDGKEKWLQYVVLDSLKLAADEKGTKASELVRMLETQIPRHIWISFQESLLAQDQPLTAVKLDELLSKASGRKTAFFYLNRDQYAKTVPLYFDMNKQLLVNGKIVSGTVLLMQNRKWVPLEELAKCIGFHYQRINGSELLLQKGQDILRFYPGEPVFILNGIDYTTESEPVLSFGGKVYISETALRSIFGGVIAEDAQSARVSLPME